MLTSVSIFFCEGRTSFSGTETLINKEFTLKIEGPSLYFIICLTNSLFLFLNTSLWDDTIANSLASG